MARRGRREVNSSKPQNSSKNFDNQNLKDFIDNEYQKHGNKKDELFEKLFKELPLKKKIGVAIKNGKTSAEVVFPDYLKSKRLDSTYSVEHKWEEVISLCIDSITQQGLDASVITKRFNSCCDNPDPGWACPVCGYSDSGDWCDDHKSYFVETCVQYHSGDVGCGSKPCREGHIGFYGILVSWPSPT